MPSPFHADLTSATARTTPSAARWWRPTPAKPLKLGWVLSGPLDVSHPSKLTANVYDIDLDYNPASTVTLLHKLHKKVICYIDAGVYENYRSDAWKFPKSVIGAPDDGWNGSYWLDIRQISVLAPIMKARIARCAAKKFDAVEPDEISDYSNDSGFPLTYADQIKYNTAVASWVHAAGMGVGLKGDIEQAKSLQPVFDWSLNEECYMYTECNDYGGGLRNFTAHGKAVWIAEYPSEYKAGTFHWAADSANARANHWNLAQYQLGLPVHGYEIYAAGTW